MAVIVCNILSYQSYCISQIKLYWLSSSLCDILLNQTHKIISNSMFLFHQANISVTQVYLASVLWTTLSNKGSPLAWREHCCVQHALSTNACQNVNIHELSQYMRCVRRCDYSRLNISLALWLVFACATIRVFVHRLNVVSADAVKLRQFRKW